MDERAVETSLLTLAWERTEAALPAGWTLDGLRCASTGLEPSQRSADWIAVAIGPQGQERAGRGQDPLAALSALVRAFEDAPAS